MIIIISTNLHTSHMIAKKKFWNLYVHICTWSKRTYCKLLLFTVYIHNCGLQNEPHFIHHDEQHISWPK